MLVPKLLVASVCLLSVTQAFPVTQLTVTQAFINALNNHSIPGAQRDALATTHILPSLRSFFGASSTAVS